MHGCAFHPLKKKFKIKKFKKERAAPFSLLPSLQHLSHLNSQHPAASIQPYHRFLTTPLAATSISAHQQPRFSTTTSHLYRPPLHLITAILSPSPQILSFNHISPISDHSAQPSSPSTATPTSCPAQTPTLPSPSSTSLLPSSPTSFHHSPHTTPLSPPFTSVNLRTPTSPPAESYLRSPLPFRCSTTNLYTPLPANTTPLTTAATPSLHPNRNICLPPFGHRLQHQSRRCSTSPQLISVQQLRHPAPPFPHLSPSSFVLLTAPTPLPLQT